MLRTTERLAYFQIVFIYNICKAVGLITFKYNRHDSTFSSSKLLIVFNRIVFIVMCFFGALLAVVVIRAPTVYENNSYFRMIVRVQYFYPVVAAIFTFHIQYKNSRKLIVHFNEYRHIFNAIDGGSFSQSQNITVRNVAVQVLTKFLMLAIQNGIIIYFLSKYSKINVVSMVSKAYWYFNHLILDTISNIYYFGLLLNTFLFTNLNLKLDSAMERIFETEINRVSNSTQMIRFCAISDEIENIFQLHNQLCRVLIKINKLFQLQILLRLIYVLTNVVIGLAGLCEVEIENGLSFATVMMFVVAFLLVADVYFMMSAVDYLEKIARYPEEFCRKTTVLKNLDVRLEQTIEKIDLNLNLNNVKIDIFGFFTINLYLFFGFLATIVENVITLIQFARMD